MNYTQTQARDRPWPLASTRGLLIARSGYRRGEFHAILCHRVSAMKLHMKVAPWPSLSVSVRFIRSSQWTDLEDVDATDLLSIVTTIWGDFWCSEQSRAHPLTACFSPRRRFLQLREHIESFASKCPARARVRADLRGYKGFLLLRLYARCPGSEKLYDETPALALGAAVHWMMRDEPRPRWDEVSRAVHTSQEGVIEFLQIRHQPSSSRVFEIAYGYEAYDVVLGALRLRSIHAFDRNGEVWELCCMSFRRGMAEVGRNPRLFSWLSTLQITPANLQEEGFLHSLERLVMLVSHDPSAGRAAFLAQREDASWALYPICFNSYRAPIERELFP
jgi:hypothetical protein